MKLNKNPGMILLSIWLIVYGLKFPFSLSVPPLILPVLALVTGVVILLLDDSFRVTLNKSLGMILLSIWLVVHGAASLFTIDVPGLHYIVPIIALAAGVVILLFDPTKLNRKLGTILLGVFLVYHGVIALFSFGATAFAYIWSLLALVTGVVILLFDRTTA